MRRQKHKNMNGHIAPLRLFYRELTYISHTHITLLPLLCLQINLKDRVQRREREGYEIEGERMRDVRWVEEREY